MQRSDNKVDVLLHYDQGFPTRLVNHQRLARLILRDGQPQEINVVGGFFKLIWKKNVGYYGATWEYSLKNPWPKDKRQLIQVEIEPSNVP